MQHFLRQAAAQTLQHLLGGRALGQQALGFFQLGAASGLGLGVDLLNQIDLPALAASQPQHEFIHAAADDGLGLRHGG